MKTCILLVNLGTPLTPSTGDVKTYLKEFLSDARVIDIPSVPRYLLVNGVIVPFRSPKSAHLYQEIWTDRGSPLLFHSQDLKDKLQTALGDQFVVELAMRYQYPSMEEVCQRMQIKNYKKIIVLPLYPQYSSSTTGSTVEKLFTLLAKWQTLPDIQVINSFYSHPEFIQAWVKNAQHIDFGQYEHILFSYHGVPERHIRKSDCSGKCLSENCCSAINNDNHQCYRASCFETTRLIAKQLNIAQEKYTVTFQSRLGKDPWIKPYSDQIIEELASKGIKKLLVFSPAFVADCLETIHEIGLEYLELFREKGGEELHLVESLNAKDNWVNALKEIVLSH